MFQKFRLAKYTLLLAMSATSFAIAITTTLAIKSPAISAERIDFNYSLLGFKIQVEDLEAFAKHGKISSSLNFYLKRISPKQTERLQKLLRQTYNVNQVLVYRYSRTDSGVKILQRIGEIIKLPGDINGFYGLRAAVVQSAGSAKGVNLVDFLKRFPTDIKLDLAELLKLVKQVSNAEDDTQEFIASLDQGKTSGENNIKNIPDFSKPGQFQVTKQTLDFYDPKRDRNLVTDLYLPAVNSKSTPVIVVSNGLGAKRARFQDLAGHLASYGFAVVIPDHPGSDRQRQLDFVRGLYKENFDATEYIDRPLDISYILDQLAKINPKQLNNSLNLEQVGIFGYSIGGTTALSLAGAEIDFPQLEHDCAQQLDLLNISVLYQCRALDMPRKKQSLKDDRIKAAYMFVPFGNSLFNKQKLKEISIPMMWQVVDRDFLTSLLNEQVPLFKSLENSSRHLVISERLPHSNVTLANEQQHSQAKAFNVAKTYQNILSLVFFQNYIAQDRKYSPYLSAEYIKAIAQKPYSLHILAK
ncbi:alpha/beta hydrolase [Pleurocapsa sp. FMAR1]|uniref:alpha/beta hydrolase n=1 Tax=Pleurocapsa sp. FMAR1 TaxID=3040204 RepID=UPI0029C6C56A|nr:alpha/beta fold hydrolase [Pleurocapsa sp. FMAR1]